MVAGKANYVKILNYIFPSRYVTCVKITSPVLFDDLPRDPLHFPDRILFKAWPSYISCVMYSGLTGLSRVYQCISTSLRQKRLVQPGSIARQQIIATIFLLRHYSSHVKKTPTEEYGFTRRKSDYWCPQDIASLPKHLRPDNGETLDLILRQKIYLLQSRRGYRANTDSHVLAFFASQVYNRCYNAFERKPLRILDLGAGVGLVSILFAKAHSPTNVHLVELQGQLANRARRNLELNEVRGSVIRHDLSGGYLPGGFCGSFDVVLVNPPFYSLGNRCPPRLRERYLSQIETSGTFSDFMRAACSACDDTNPDAFIAVIHDRRELPRLKMTFQESDIIVCDSQDMCHGHGDDPTRILFHLKPKSLSHNHISQENIPSIPPLMLRSDPYVRNMYSDAMEQFFQKLPLPSLRIGRLRE